MSNNIVEFMFNDAISGDYGRGTVTGDIYVDFTSGGITGAITGSLANNLGGTSESTFTNDPAARNPRFGTNVIELSSNGDVYKIEGSISGPYSPNSTVALEFTGTRPTSFSFISYTYVFDNFVTVGVGRAFDAPVTTNIPGALILSGLDSSGNAHGAKPLVANVTDPDGIPGSATYTFSEAGTVVQAGVSNSYTPSYNESGKALSVSVSYTDGKGRSSTLSASAGTLQGGQDPLQVSDFVNKPASDTLNGLKDFGGNHLGATWAWRTLGQVDIQGDGDLEYVLVNQEIGRWATLGPDPRGTIDLASHGENGDTRVVGVYLDPLIVTGVVQSGSDFDSQRRFENDLRTDNIDLILGAGDYDRNGLQEVYFGLKDHSAVLHAYMHADGNIQYANYQNGDQMRDYLASHGFSNDWVV